MLEGGAAGWKAVPGVATNAEEVLAGAGSRYTYSANTIAFDEAMEKEGKLAKDKAGGKEGENVKAAASSEVDVMTVAENAAREEKANGNTAEELADLKCSANGADHFDRGLEQAGDGEAEGGAGG